MPASPVWRDVGPAHTESDQVPALPTTSSPGEVMKTLVLLLVSLLMSALPAEATGVDYTFSGVGLAGHVVLDDGAPVVQAGTRFFPNVFTRDSPIQRIAGTFNGVAFEGPAELVIEDSPAFFGETEYQGLDAWIIYGFNLTGAFNFVRLFSFESPTWNLLGFGLPPSLIDTHLCCASGVMDGSMEYVGQLAGGPIVQGPMDAWTRGEHGAVPEPSSLLLLAAGLVVLRRVIAR